VHIQKQGVDILLIEPSATSLRKKVTRDSSPARDRLSWAIACIFSRRS
jgi:hypothetical protein